MAKNNKRYSIEEKQRLIKRMLPPENCSVTKLSNETGVHKSTLSTWKTKALKGQPARECGRPKDTLSSREKFMIVMETYTLSEIELSKYCREHGLYVEDVKKWRSSCMEANTTKKTNTANAVELKTELVEEKKKSKELEKELRRKDKALAETAALLVLRKKLVAIFGENEEG
jgi:transposase-like protein